MSTATSPAGTFRIRKPYRQAAMFAGWCQRENVNPVHVAELCALTEAAVRAGVREANHGEAAGADRARERVEHYAHAVLGWDTEWPGLYPLFRKRTRPHADIHLPYLDT